MTGYTGMSQELVTSNFVELVHYFSPLSLCTTKLVWMPAQKKGHCFNSVLAIRDVVLLMLVAASTVIYLL